MRSARAGVASQEIAAVVSGTCRNGSVELVCRAATLRGVANQGAAWVLADDHQPSMVPWRMKAGTVFLTAAQGLP